MVEIDPRTLEPGDSIEGVVLRPPHPDFHRGSSIVLRRDDGEKVLIVGSAKQGHATLQRALTRLDASEGDRLRIVFSGWRQTRDGARRYRLWEVPWPSRSDGGGGE